MRLAGTVLIVLVAVLLLGFPGSSAEARDRVALVIGNASYADRPLATARSDASELAVSLRGLGYRVNLVLDADLQTLRSAVSDFDKRLGESDALGVIFFAGYALQAGDQNYLVPVGARIESENDIAFEGLDLSRVLNLLSRVSGRSLAVFVDAARRTPYQSRVRTLARGLVPVSVPVGTAVMLSASPGQVTLDGNGRLSPFADALTQALSTPGLRVEQIMSRVTQDVMSSTNRIQKPWYASNLPAGFSLADSKTTGSAPLAMSPPAPAPAPAPRDEVAILPSDDDVADDDLLLPLDDSPLLESAESDVPEAPAKDDTQVDTNTPDTNRSIELSFWDSVRSLDNPEAYRTYIRRFPDGAFVELAKIKLQQLDQSKAVRAPESARPRPVMPSPPRKPANSNPDTVFAPTVVTALPSKPHAVRAPAPEDPDPASVSIARHPTIEAPDSVRPEERFPVQFWLTEERLTPEVRVKPRRGEKVTREGLTMTLQPPKPGTDYWDLDVTLWAPGFALADEGEWNRTLRLYRDGDSEPVRFDLRAPSDARDKPDRDLHFRLYHEGRYLGSAVRTVSVQALAETALQDRAPDRQVTAAPDKLKGAISLSNDPVAPDMHVVILYEHDARGVPVSGHIDILSRLRPGHVVSTAFEVNPGIEQWLTDTYARLVSLGSQVRLSRALGKAADTVTGRTEAIAIARARGRELYDHHIPQAFKTYFWTLIRDDPYREKFRSIQITTNDLRLPWELARPVSPDGEARFDFLGIEFKMARWNLRETSGQRQLPPQSIPFAELPTIAPNYSGKSYLPFQKAELDMLSRVAGFRQVGANIESIAQLMQRPIRGIVHFTGHGEVSDAGQGRPAFAIRLDENRPLGTDTWSGLAASGAADHPFFFFNACDTGQSKSLGGFVQGWGPALLAAGASGFIGGLWPLVDGSAAEFSAAFYRRFSEEVKTGSVDMAALVRDVKRGFLETGDPTYLAYALYGDVNLRFVAAEK